MNPFEEMKKQIQEKAKSVKQVGELFEEYGITPDNPANIARMLKEAGLGDIDPFQAAAMAQSMMNSFTPEMKANIAGLIMEITRGIPTGPMPGDIQDMLES